MSKFDLPEPSFKINPLKDCLADVPITGKLDKDAKAELSAVLAAFKKRDKKEQVDKRAILDSEYWFCICFQSREQKDAFLKALDLFEHGDKYLDGQFVAKKLGIAIPSANVRYHEREERKSYTDQVGTIRKLPKKGGE